MSRILFLDQYGGIGGGQTVLLSLLRAACKVSREVSVLAPGGGTLETTIRSEFGSAVTFVPWEEPRLSHGRKGLRDIIGLLVYGWRFRRHLPLLRAQDVIYVNGLRHLPHMLWLSRRLHARLIYHIHINHTAPEKFLLRLTARSPRTFRIIVNSEFVAKELHIGENQLSLIENALDTAFARLAFVDRFEKPHPWVSAVIGTLRREKGQDIAIEAVEARNDMTLHLIGSHGEGAQAWILELRREAGAHIHFDGPVSNVAEKIGALQIQFNLVPSRWDEPFGLVAIEGMACSCITIVSGSGGLGDIAAKTGALVARNKAELVQTLDRLCAMPRSDLTDMARRQFDATLAAYSPSRFEGDIVKLLQAAIGAAGKAA